MPASHGHEAARTLAEAGVAVDGAERVSGLESGWLLAGSDVVVHHDLNATRFYRHGWQSWSMSGWESLHTAPSSIAVPELRRQADDPGLGDREGHVGSWVGAVETEEGVGVLLGALGLDARVSASQGVLRGEAETEVEWFLAKGPAEKTLTGYGEILVTALGRRVANPGPIWCTWYSQGRSLDERSLHALIDEVSDLPFAVFLVDDGWERGIGDWRPNPSFPGGMAPIADEIVSRGMSPGLWLAPLAVEADQVRRWRGCLVEDEAGEPLVAGRNWDTEYFAVDVSSSEARERVIESLTTAVDWGYTYLKLDFMFAGAIPGRRTTDEPRERIYRDAVEEIRASLGDGVHLNACGAPVIPSVGVFDSIRIGPDVAPYWESPLYDYVGDYSAPGTRRAISTSLARLWLGQAIQPDPDVAFFRSRRNLLDEGQRQLLQDVASITGFLATSDPPSWLDTEELEALRIFLEGPSPITSVDRYRFLVGERHVDFGLTVDGAFG